MRTRRPCWHWRISCGPSCFTSPTRQTVGSHHPGAVIAEMLSRLPDGTLMVLDEAYIDLAPEGTAPEINAG